MHFYPSCVPLPRALRGGSLVIGNFDGCHIGHQHLLRRAQGRGPVVVLTFHPHPAVVLGGHESVDFVVQSLPERVRRLRRHGAHAVRVVPFGTPLASLSAEAFVRREVLGCEPARVVIGNDFRFGNNRRGSPETLRSMGLEVEAVLEHEWMPGRPASSRELRRALKEGQMDEVRILLGESFSCTRAVVKGNGFGSRLGFPTANLNYGPFLSPRCGVYAATATIMGEDPNKHRSAAVYVGRRPSIPQTDGALRFEVHLPGFGGTLEGRRLHVRLRRFIRDDAKLPSLEALRQQIHDDVGDVLSALSEDDSKCAKAASNSRV